MPVYKLEPIEELEDGWRGSDIGSMAVWVRACDTDDARQKIHLATISTVEEYDLGRLDLASSPWLNSAIVDCDEDESRDVPDGVALLGNGRTVTL